MAPVITHWLWRMAVFLFVCSAALPASTDEEQIVGPTARNQIQHGTAHSRTRPPVRPLDSIAARLWRVRDLRVDYQLWRADMVVADETNRGTDQLKERSVDLEIRTENGLVVQWRNEKLPKTIIIPQSWTLFIWRLLQKTLRVYVRKTSIGIKYVRKANFQ